MKSSSYADAVVTARVPRGVKQRGDAILRNIGSSPTKLINAAYNYLIEHEVLPGHDALSENASGHRKLNSEQISALKNWAQDVSVGKLETNQSFDQLKEQAFRDRFSDCFSQTKEAKR